MNPRNSILPFAIVLLCCLSCKPTEPEYEDPDPIYHFIDIQFADEQHGLLVADASMYQTVDGGRTWKLSGWGPTFLKNAGYADLNTAVVVGNNWTVLRTADGGQTWTSPLDKDDFEYSAGFRAVSFVDSRTGWIAGGYDKIFRTLDGGVTWERQRCGASSDHIYDVCFTDANTGTLATSRSIIRTEDGGLTWTRQKDRMEQVLLGVSFVDANTGVIVGADGLIMGTTDGGTTWKTQHKSPDDTIQLWDVCLTDAYTGTVVGSGGRILRSVDGGDTWIEQSSGTDQRLRGVAFVNADTGMVVGSNNVILRTSNGGQNWTALRFWTSLDPSD